MIILFCILLFILLTNLYLYHQFPKHDMQQQHYDACIVLGSPSNEDGTCTRIQIGRMNRAIELYNAHKVSNIIVSGGSVKNEHIEAYTMMQYALSQGVQSHVIIVEEKARNSYENLLYSKAICDQHHMTSVVVVTSNFHTRRASFFVNKFFQQYAMAGTREKEKTKHYISEYFRMWNTLRIEFINAFK